MEQENKYLAKMRADQMYSGILANRMRELKETEKGVDDMCKVMDEIYKEGELYGEKQGEVRIQKSVAASLARKGMEVSEIAQVVEASEKLVRAWISGAAVTVK